MPHRDHCGHNVISPDDVPMPFAELAPDGRVLACNPALLKLAGYNGAGPDKLPPLIDLIPPEWRPDNAKAEQLPGEIHFSAKLPAKDGTRISVEVFVRRVNDDRGLPCRFLAGILDMPTIWTLETGLIHAEQQSSIASLIMDELQSPIFATDEHSRIVYANTAASRLFGRPAYDVVGVGLWDAYPISHHDLLYRMYHRAIQERRVLACDHYSQKLNIWYEARFFPWMGGGDGGIIVTLNNVTARKQYERFMGLAAYTVNKLSDYVFWLGKNGRIIRANDIAAKNLSFPELPRARTHISEVTGIRPDRWEKIWEEIKGEGSITIDTTLLRRNGSPLPAEASISYVTYVGQEYGIIIARDISPRLADKEEISRAREQAELYLDLMSHDIRNINQIGAGFIELAISDPSLSEDERELLEKPLEAFHRSTELISNVSKLQQATGTLTTREIDLADMLGEVAAQYKEVRGRDVSIELRSDEGCCVVANPLLKEVFSNLVGNAIKHSEGRIGIWITLRKTIVADRPCCEVIIEDDGPGIPDDVKVRLFSSKKLREKGSRHRGLGLILVKTLLDDFNGAIDVEDRVKGDYGKGTRFVITLPAADKSI